jgi:hypothetical protein
MAEQLLYREMDNLSVVEGFGILAVVEDRRRYLC